MQLLRVCTVESKTALCIFDNKWIRNYIKCLDSKHRPMHWLERIRIAEVMIDLGMLEFSHIAKVR